MAFIINAKNRNGDEGTIISDGGFYYSLNLNEFNEGELKISGSGTVKRGLLEAGSEIKIFRDGNLEFFGVIDMIDKLDAGTVVAHVSGYEFWLGKENGEYSNSPWSNTASATIFSQIIGESNYWDAGTINTGFSLDFRLSESQSLWNAIGALSNKTQQDIDRDYEDLEINILNHLGSSSSVGIFNDGINISNFRFTEGYPLGNHIIVYGQGDGDFQIKGEAEDASSIASFGRIKRIVTDRSIISNSEADKVAEAELALTKNPTRIYDFDLNNPYENIGLGDVITLYSADKDVNGVEVRVVSVERGERNGMEYCSLQVTNPEYKQMVKTRNKILSNLTKQNIDNSSYSWGSGNTLTYTNFINAKSGAPLVVMFNLPQNFIEDEVGNIRVANFTADFRLEGYRSEVGEAEYVGGDAPVNDSSGSQGANVSGSAGNTAPGISGTAANNNPFIDNSTGSNGASVSGATSANAVGTAVQNPSSGTVFFSTSINTTLSQVASHSYIGLGSAMRVFEIRALEIDADAWVYIQVEQNTSVIHQGWHWLGFVEDHTFRFPFFTPSNLTGTCRVRMKTLSGTRDVLGGFTTMSEASHSHGQGSLAAASHFHNSGSLRSENHGHGVGSYGVNSHGHSSGSFAADSHLHGAGTYKVLASSLDDLNITTGVSQSGSLNASDVQLFVDRWDGATWVNKLTTGLIGATQATDVDLSLGGTLPDDSGLWRVRVEPNNANPDFVLSLVKLKHHLRNT